MSLRLGFAGTPEFARDLLSEMISADLVPKLVLTQPDRPAGRGKKLQPSPVRQLAESHGLAVETPSSLKAPDSCPALTDAHLDVLVVAAYGLILPAHVLQRPRHGCFNVHASLLPRWRGAAPIERALMAGDTQTGVCIMQMDEGLDTGAVLAREAISITAATTTPDLEQAMVRSGAGLLAQVLADLEQQGSVAGQPQSGEPTYAHKLTSADAHIDWTQSAKAIDRQIRALSHRQAPWSQLAGHDLRVRLYQARPKSDQHAADPGTLLSAGRHGIDVACGTGTLSIQRLAVNRGKATAMAPADLLNGYGDLLQPGVRFE